jgi:hypothetical protein
MKNFHLRHFMPLLSLLIFSTFSIAQNPTFQKSFGGNGDDVAFQAAETSNGYIVAGYTSSSGAGGQDAILIRLDLNGNVMWQHTYGGAGDDNFIQVITGNDGGFLAVGETQSYGQGGKDVFLVKTDENGNVLWSKTYGSGSNDYLNRGTILRVPNGYIIGSEQDTYTYPGSTGSYLIRFDNNGNTIWEHAYTSNGLGNIMLASYADGDTLYSTGFIEGDAGFVKLNINNGDIYSAKLFGGGNLEALYQISPTADGNLMLSDHTWSAGPGVRQWVAKVGKNGAVLWSKTYYLPGQSMRGFANRMSDGGFILAPFNISSLSSQTPGIMTKIDANGQIIWSYAYTGGYGDRLIYALPTSDKGVIAVGNTVTANGDNNIFVVKIDANGLIAGCCKKTVDMLVEDFPVHTGNASFYENDFPEGFSHNIVNAPAVLQSASVCLNPQPTATHHILLEPGEPYVIGGINHFAPDSVQTIEAATPCDSLITYILQLKPVNLMVQTQNPTCALPASGQIQVLSPLTYSFSLNNGPLQSTPLFSNLGPGSYLITALHVQTGYTVDTTVVLTIAPSTVTTSTDVVICPNASVTIGGVVYTAPGIVNDTIQGIAGCDTIAVYHLIRGLNPMISHTVEFCPGGSVVINGVTYTHADTAITYLIPATMGCDTLVVYYLKYAPQPVVTRVIQFCPGHSVTIAGVIHTQPDTITGITLPATSGCDTLVTYILQYAPQPSVTRTVLFCPGTSVTIGGITYTQPGTVHGVIPASAGCDTLATYILQYAPQPAVTRTVQFCPGTSVTIGGITYTQPGTVHGVIAASVGCDTVVTYILKYLVPAYPTSVTINCPNDTFVNINPGDLNANVAYSIPTANSNCPCPGVQLHLQQGLPSGGLFPTGLTNVCYLAKDSCGNKNTCCFKITVQETPACDIKEIVCIKYELLSITEDAQQRKTYRIRTTNHCTNRMIYMLVETPNGIVSYLPADNSTFTAPSGRTYTVRNPNYSPFYSVRYSSLSDSIQNGEADIFKYTLPAQADPTYIHVMVKLEPQIYYEAYLNVFNCPVVFSPNHRAEKTDQTVWKIFPNPSEGYIACDLGKWTGQKLDVQVLNLEGKIIQSVSTVAGMEPQVINLPESLVNGLYLIRVKPETGEIETRKFMLQR